MARLNRIGEQIQDDAGNPLLKGKIFFFESGTNTPKDTFKDVGLSTKNDNPVILTGAGRVPNIIYNGSAKAILTDADGVQLDSIDPYGGEFTQGVFSPWNALTLYDVPDKVIASNGFTYESITNGNEDNDPTTSPANWTRIKDIRVYNSLETYQIDDPVQASNGFIYSSKTADNLGNDPATSTINWRVASDLDVPKVILAAGHQFAYNNF